MHTKKTKRKSGEFQRNVRAKKDNTTSFAAKKSLAIEKSDSPIEVKVVDTSGISVLPINNLGPTFLLNGVAVGSNMYNRTGRRVALKSIHIKGTVLRSMGNAAPIPADYPLRIALIYDKQPNAAAPAITAIFQNRTNGGVASSQTLSHINMDNRDRFVVLRDWFFQRATIGINGLAVASFNVTDVGGGEESVSIDWFVDLRGLKTTWGGDGTGIADITTGALWLVGYSAEDTNATSAYQLQFSSRLRYLDG